ncbi:hypothetical protein EYF80_067323 [Liparis tanakae]|uniref:Uncharacterized protein n=1 Tax=Liparis tanakae TaxID=230148 RepID=A0A4Z2E1C8_9TELE|nr:hypothetical protein EYF80_067323 [Liparis tanakae]
MENAKPTP